MMLRRSRHIELDKFRIFDIDFCGAWFLFFRTPPQQFTQTQSSSQKTSSELSRPARCQHLYGTQTKWDPETEEYETDGRWAECMGVGKR